MQKHKWTIHVKDEGDQLRLPQKNTLELAPGDSVVWVFDFEIAPGQWPVLALSPASGIAAKGPFGPFTQMTFFHGDDNNGRFRICCSGFGGDTSSVSYRAEVWSGASESEAVKVSNYSTLTFQATDLSIAQQQITVSLILRDPDLQPLLQPMTPKLNISPEHVSIVPGEPVVWDFHLPLDVFEEETWYPEVIFTDPQHPFGPFQAMSILVEPAGTDPNLGRRVKLIGTGHRGDPGSFAYTCRVQGSGGVHAVNSGDPTVDDDGMLMTPPDLSQAP